MNNKISLIIFICCAILIHVGILIHKDVYADKYAYKEINSNYPYATNYELFIKEYPNSKYVKDAYNELYQMALEQGTFEALINYQKKYPKSPHIKDAKIEVDKKSNTLYEEAKKINSINAWENFLIQTPKTHHKDANQILENLENKLWGTDNRAWTQANEENTISSFTKYLNLYPNGKKKSSANQKLIDLEVANIFAGEHGTLPSMDKTSYGYGSETNIEIYNNTRYTLTLLYSGAVSKRVIISPKQYKYLSLKNGKYKVAASVNDKSVRNYAGIEELDGGKYEVEYYISTGKY